MAREFQGALAMGPPGLASLPFLLAALGVITSYVFYLVKPSIPAAIKQRFSFVYRLLDNKYYMDWFNENVLARAARIAGQGLWKGGDVGLIDGIVIDGSARAVGGMAAGVRLGQRGFLYWYALGVILGVLGVVSLPLWPAVRGIVKAV